jgi:hypothetical protein
MRALFLTLAAIVGSGAFTSQQAAACWCNRLYTSYYVDPCVTCPTASQPACSIPQANCYTACEQRCYLEPQIGYQVVTRLEPQTFFVRRSYYDPISCCQRSYYWPATQLVERAYQVPVTSYVQRCYTDPGSTSQPARNGSQGESESGVQSESGDRGESGLDRPVYRESAPKPEPPPKPVPMPSPQTLRERSVTAYGPRFGSPPPVMRRSGSPLVYWPPTSMHQ